MKRTLRRAIGLLLSAAMTVGLMPVFSVSAAAELSGLPGSGTEPDPYLISTNKDFDIFRDYVNNGNDCVGKYIRLDADIDLSVSEDVTVPIGTSKTPFNGHFDGNTHKVKGIKMFASVPEDDYQGLFGYIGSEGTIDRLSVSGQISAGRKILIGRQAPSRANAMEK